MWNVLAPKKRVPPTTTNSVYVFVYSRNVQLSYGIDVSSFIGECSSCVKTNPQDPPQLPVFFVRRASVEGKKVALIIYSLRFRGSIFISIKLSRKTLTVDFHPCLFFFC